MNVNAGRRTRSSRTPRTPSSHTPLTRTADDRVVPAAVGMSRRRMLAGLVTAPVAAAFATSLAAVVVAGCGDERVEPVGSESPGTTLPSTPGSIPGSTPGSTPPATDTPGTDPSAIGYPTDAATAIVRITYEGGFVPVDFAFVNTPSLVVSGDGYAYTPGAVATIYPGPLVTPMARRSISEAGIQRLLTLAQELGLLAPPPDYETEMTIADAPFTVVRLVTADGSWEHMAYALGLGSDGSGGPSPETSPARRALLEFVVAATDLATTVGAGELGVESIHEPTEYRLRAEAMNAAATEGMDPAPVVVDWPATTGLDLATATACARLDAEAAGSLFADATQLTWFRQDGVVHRIAVAGVLPGDPAC